MRRAATGHVDRLGAADRRGVSTERQSLALPAATDAGARVARSAQSIAPRGTRTRLCGPRLDGPTRLTARVSVPRRQPRALEQRSGESNASEVFLIFFSRERGRAVLGPPRRTLESWEQGGQSRGRPTQNAPQGNDRTAFVHRSDLPSPLQPLLSPCRSALSSSRSRCCCCSPRLRGPAVRDFVRGARGRLHGFVRGPRGVCATTPSQFYPTAARGAILRPRRARWAGASPGGAGARRIPSST